MSDEIRGILGDKGSCKTLFVVFLMDETNNLGGSVASNIRSYQGPQVFTPFNEAVKVIESGLGQQVLGGKTIVFDELGKGADSYDFFERNPRKLSELVMEIRKYQSIMYYTTQRHGLVTKRIREQVSVFYVMEPIPIGYRLQSFSPVEKNALLHDRHPDYTLLLDGRVVLKGRAVVHQTEGPPWYREIRTFHFDGRAYFDRYNTHEVIGA